MKRFLYSLLLVAILVPQVSFAADSYGWSKFFLVPNATGPAVSTQYYSHVYGTSAECVANANLSMVQVGLPNGTISDPNKPVVCFCGTPLAAQGATCDAAKFTGAQTARTAALATPTAPTTPQVQAPTSLGFVPLTSIPGIESAGNSATLPDFLNNLYKLAIGVAAVLAVLQIVRAGIMYMGGDSVWEKKEAKSLIALSIGGLILILSPVVVFSVINPKILDLKIDGLDALGTPSLEGNTARMCSPACTDGKICDNGTCIVRDVGDGTCSVDCVAGRTCKQGVCVVGTTNACSPVANGAVVPTIATQNCCAAQPGCRVQISLTNALASPSCSCTQTATTIDTTQLITIVRYVFIHNGSIVPKDQALYDAYKKACVANNKEVIETTGSVQSQRLCSSDERTSGDSETAKCVNVKIGCL